MVLGIVVVVVLMMMLVEGRVMRRMRSLLDMGVECR
jgi:hypothetical protein